MRRLAVRPVPRERLIHHDHDHDAATGDDHHVTTTTTTTTIVGLDEAAVTTTTEPTGVGVLTGPPTTHGSGIGELQGVSELPDLEITGMEIAQGIQNLAKDMPLVADRTTVLRVYLQAAGESVPHVSGVLQLVRDGTQEVAVIEPDNGPLAVGGGPHEPAGR